MPAVFVSPLLEPFAPVHACLGEIIKTMRIVAAQIISMRRNLVVQACAFALNVGTVCAERCRAASGMLELVHFDDGALARVARVIG